MNVFQITIDLTHGGETAVHTTAVELIQKYPLVAVLVPLMLLDIMTGLAAGWIAKKLCSSASFRGMVGKFQILAMVASAMLFEMVVPQMPWGSIVAFFFVITECISITENAANSGVPIPQQWTDALRKARADAENKATPPPLVQVTAKDAHIQDSQVRVQVEKPNE